MTSPNNDKSYTNCLHGGFLQVHCLTVSLKGNVHLIFISFVGALTQGGGPNVIFIFPKVKIQSLFCSDFYSLLNSSDKQNVSTYVELLEPLFSTRRYPVTTRASNEPLEKFEVVCSRRRPLLPLSHLKHY